MSQQFLLKPKIARDREFVHRFPPVLGDLFRPEQALQAIHRGANRVDLALGSQSLGQNVLDARRFHDSANWATGDNTGAGRRWP